MLVNISVAIFRVNMYWGFWKPFVDQAIGNEWDVQDIIFRAEKHTAVEHRKMLG
jgi:hypothetical protein